MQPHWDKNLLTRVEESQDDAQSLDENSGIQLVVGEAVGSVHEPTTTKHQYPDPDNAKVKLSVGAFTAQCAKCFKWRLIPTKEKYEEIRGCFSDEPFVCETAREWRPDVTCDEPTDISQDESKIWAIDVPNISQPPPGWERLIRFRGEGSTRFADVYYVTPSGEKLRSFVEINSYLDKNPEYTGAGVSKSQFSFRIPRPLQKNYVRKRSSHMKYPSKDVDIGMSKLLEPDEAIGPVKCSELPVGGMDVLAPYFESPILHPRSPPAKMKAIRSSRKRMYNKLVDNQHGV